MEKIFIWFSIFLLIEPIAAQNKLKSNLQSLVIKNTTVVDVTSGTLKEKMSVVISGNSITAVGKTENLKIWQNAEVIDAGGKFLIPGLWDMHVHVDNNGDWMFPLFLANGVTGLRDMGSHIKQIASWREMQKRNVLMPDIVAAGPLVSGKIGDHDPRMILVGTGQEAINAVNNLAAQKVDFIKVHDWVGPVAYKKLIEESKKHGLPLVGHIPVLLTAAEVSNANQRSIEHYGNVWGGLFVDCSSQEDALRREMQALSQQISPEFDPSKLFAQQGEDWSARLADSYDDAKAQQIAQIFKRNQTWLVPTIQSSGYAGIFISEEMAARDARLKYFPLTTQKSVREMVQASNGQEISAKKLADKRKLYQKQLEMIRTFKRAGVQFLAGTDAIPFPPAFPGFDLHDELQRFVEAGFTPLEALQTATINPAKFLGKTNFGGTIEAGKLADLVLLDANPLVNIENTRKIAAVFVKGRYLSSDSLQKMLLQVEAINNR